MKKILFSLLTILLPLGLRAQEAHWTANTATYYTMTVWAIVELEGNELTTTAQLSNIEVAAFCGDECRGVVQGAEFQTAGAHKVLQLTIHSNTATGETISFKAYLKNSGEEESIKSTAITFEDNATIGMPSNPIVLKIKPPYTLGDVNGDDKINVSDASAIVDYVLNPASVTINLDAADVTGDSKVNVSDASKIVDYVLGNATLE